jgi:hypothetical protein
LRHRDVKITLIGQLLKVDGGRVSFNVSETFTAESRTELLTLWQEVATW